MGALSSMFVSITETANSVIIICVLFSFFAMVMLLMKALLVLRGPRRMGVADESHWSTPAAPEVPRLRMTRVHIPFTFRVLDSTNEEPHNELRCAVSSRVAYSLLAFWAVPIIDLHRALWRPWPELRSLLESLTYKKTKNYKTQCLCNKNDCTCCTNNTKFEENPGGYSSTYCDTDCASTSSGNTFDDREMGVSPFGHAHREQILDLAHDEKAVTLRPPWPGEPGPLGEPPRKDYPLVVLLKREDEGEQSDTQSSDETVALVNVVHLRDPVCPLPTSMLGQYLKQASGQLSSLKQLYLATPGDSTPNDSTSGNSTPDITSTANFSAQFSSSPESPYMGTISEQLCVVCQSFPLSRALLPCRHTCICAVCFGKLDRCPMCRAPISSFFTIRAEDYIPQTSHPGHHSVRSRKLGAAVWLDALNDRLTDFLGFR